MIATDPPPADMYSAQSADLRANMKARYVVGFPMTATTGRVLLEQKNKPPWMAGKYNGPGGKVEPGEMPLSAMSREFNEECGLLVPRIDWMRYHDEVFASGAEISFFTCEITDRQMDEIVVRTRESAEPCKDFLINAVINGMAGYREQCLYNIPYLVAMGATMRHVHPSNRPIRG